MLVLPYHCCCRCRTGSVSRSGVRREPGWSDKGSSLSGRRLSTSRPAGSVTSEPSDGTMSPRYHLILGIGNTLLHAKVLGYMTVPSPLQYRQLSCGQTSADSLDHNCVSWLCTLCLHVLHRNDIHKIWAPALVLSYQCLKVSLTSAIVFTGV